MKKVVKIYPTTAVVSVATNGLLFDVTEIPNVTSRLGGTTLLKSVVAIAESSTQYPETDLIFFKKGDSSLGTIGSVLDSNSATAINDNELIGVVSLAGVDENESADLGSLFVSSTLNIDLLLESDKNEQSIYVAGIAREAYDSDSSFEIKLSLGFEQ